MQLSPIPHAPPRAYPTEIAAPILGVKAQTMRAGLCVRGEYMGLRPTKLPNRRLLWDADAVDRLARGEALPAPTPPPTLAHPSSTQSHSAPGVEPVTAAHQRAPTQPTARRQSPPPTRGPGKRTQRRSAGGAA